MNLGISRDECESILMRLHTKTPPERISPIFVETVGAEKVTKKIHQMIKAVSQGKDALFLIIKADRGAGKTAVLQYVKEKLSDEVFFVYQEKLSVSQEKLFRFFVNSIGRQRMVEAVRAISSDPLTVYRNLSEGGHNGTAIALAGLLDSEESCWSWLSSRSPVMVRLKCGLRMVKNVDDSDAFEALTTVVNLLSKHRPVVYAIDELESAFNELKDREKSKIGGLFVDLINRRGLSKILFLFAATDPVYEQCFLTPDADSRGLKRRVEDATIILGLPTPEEVSLILERILGLYTCAYNITFSDTEMKQIKQSYDISTSTMPSFIVSYSLRTGDRRMEDRSNEEKIREMLEREKEKPREQRDRIAVGKEFEDAVGILLRSIPKSEFHLGQIDAIPEGEQLKKEIPDIKQIQKYLDWSFQIESVRVWVEACITKKESSTIPTPKALAVLAKTLYNEGSIGLFVTHNYNRFYNLGKGAGRVILRHPELERRVGILNLDEEEFKLLMGILNVEEKNLQSTADFVARKIGLIQKVENLRGGRHFF